MPPKREHKAALQQVAGAASAIHHAGDGTGRAGRREGEERGRLLCDAAIEIAAALYSVPVGQLRRNLRAPRRITRVRQVAMYAAHTVLGLSQREVGLAFGRDRTTVVHACHTIEDLRDDKAFDQTVMLFERILVAVLRARQEDRR